jgi:hypothetical protein
MYNPEVALFGLDPGMHVLETATAEPKEGMVPANRVCRLAAYPTIATRSGIGFCGATVFMSRRVERGHDVVNLFSPLNISPPRFWLGSNYSFVRAVTIAAAPAAMRAIASGSTACGQRSSGR